MQEFATYTNFSWRQRGVLAFIAERGQVSFEDLIEAGNIGKEGLRHILKALKKAGLIEIPRLRNDRNRFIASKYQLTAKGRGEDADIPKAS